MGDHRNAVDGTGRNAKDVSMTCIHITNGDKERAGDTGVVLNEALTNLDVVIKKTGTLITYDKLPVVMGDQMQLCQLFHHLLDNAIKFRSTNPPKVHISARQEGDDWVFSVQDNV